MSHDIKKHIQLVENQLSENPLASLLKLGKGAKNTARIMPDPEDTVIPNSRALTPATELPPGLDAEIAQRITVLKAARNVSDRKQILTTLDQAEGLLKAIDRMPEDMVRDALKGTGLTINNVRTMAKRMVRVKAQIEDMDQLNRRVWREAVKDAAEIKATAQAAAKATDIEAVSVVIRNTIAIAAGAGLLGFLAAAALDQRDDVEEDAQLDENPLSLVKRLAGLSKQYPDLPPIHLDDLHNIKIPKDPNGKPSKSDKNLLSRAARLLGLEKQYPDLPPIDLSNMPKLEKPQGAPIDKSNKNLLSHAARLLGLEKQYPDLPPIHLDDLHNIKIPKDVSYRAAYATRDLNAFTGKPLTPLELAVRAAFDVSFFYVPATMFGAALGRTSSDVIIALQEPTDQDRESVKRMRAWIKQGFKDQAAWLAGVTADQVKALVHFIKTGEYQPVDEEELTQRMEALRAKLEAE
jgi:hypothetical protein